MAERPPKETKITGGMGFLVRGARKAKKAAKKVAKKAKKAAKKPTRKTVRKAPKKARARKAKKWG